MDKTVLFDTDILIDLSRNDSIAKAVFSKLEKNHFLTISIITKMEMMVGCRNKKELKELESFLSLFRVFPMSEGISQMACDLLSQYRLSHGLLLPDSLIAATARYHSLNLISKNQKDFAFVDGLKLLPYPMK